MPYIKENERSQFNPQSARTPVNKGQLTFQMTQLAKFYLDQNGESFDKVGDIVAALECTKLEFYRRIIGPYEDTKVITNGDVY